MNSSLVYKNKIAFYIPLLIIILMHYRNGWFLKGSYFLEGREVYLIVVLSMILFILIFDFNHFLSQNILYYINNNLIFLVLFGLWFLSTILFNQQEITKGKYYIFRYFSFLFYFVIYFVIFPKFILQNVNFFKKFILFVITWGSVTAFLGIFFLFFGLNPPGKYSEFAVSYIWHPNTTAFVYTVSIIATVYYLFWKIKSLSISSILLIVISLLFQFGALYLTYCRAAVIGVLVGISIFFFISYKKKLILIFPLLLIIVPPIIDKYLATKGIGSAYSRYMLWMDAIKLITQSRNRFLWGYGVTDNMQIFLKDTQFNNPHNFILSLLIMFGGIFTVVVLLYLAYTLASVSLRGFKSNKISETYFFAFLVSAIVALLVQNLFDSLIVMPELICMQYILIYLGLSHYVISRRKKQILIKDIWNENEIE